MEHRSLDRPHLPRPTGRDHRSSNKSCKTHIVLFPKIGTVSVIVSISILSRVDEFHPVGFVKPGLEHVIAYILDGTSEEIDMIVNLQ